VRQNLAEDVVGKGLGGTVRVIDAQYFAVCLRSSLVVWLRASVSAIR
jgi:hypothetical protein